MDEYIIHSDAKEIFKSIDSSFDRLMDMQGEVYRELEGRSTQRIKILDKFYFIKKHTGVGWREVIKNLLQLKLPVVSAKNEYVALSKLKKLKINVPNIIAFGNRGNNPAKINSFILTDELPKYISLEDFCKYWPNCPPSFHFKHMLIKEIAKISRIMHFHGINHRDYYICHLLLDVKDLINSKIKLYLIDLHRAMVNKVVSNRWLAKDLSALYFSSKNIGLTKRDILRFIKEYQNKPLKVSLKKDLNFWLKVGKRGDKLFRKKGQLKS
ncbi:lipopolysaccharide core heptose(I) kinase RfaP [Gammaproteobacteria bacterium]|nr:lipopolysaccharide core heptose(I) kinase RfaP [Gammaproteobacteria bacterium]